MQYRRGVIVSTIQINAGKGAAVAAIDDSVWVQHRDDFEYNSVAQLRGERIVTEQVVHQPLNDVAAVGLARVHAARKYDHWTSLQGSQIVHIRCNCHDVTPIAAQRTGQEFASENRADVWVVFILGELLLEEAVRVRKARCKIEG